MPRGVYKRKKGIHSGKNNPMYGKIGKDNPNYGSARSQKTRKKIKHSKLGKKNPNFGKLDENSLCWKGDNTTTGPMHQWVVKKLGKASNYKCIDCNNQARDWSNVDHVYNKDLDDFAPRCRSCHTEYDKKFNNTKRGRLKKAKQQ